MYGHRRGESTSSGGSGGAHGLSLTPPTSSNRSSSSMNRLSVGNEAQPHQRGAFSSTASSRQHAEAAAARRSSTPVQSPAIGPKRHARSHQLPLNSQRMTRSGSEGADFAGQMAASAARMQSGNGRSLSRIGTASMMTTTPTATNIVNGLVSPGLHAFNTADGQSGHFHTHHHNGSSGRVSGSWDDNQNVYERLASVHTQSSQARILATRSSSYSAQTSSTPAGGSMMTSGNVVSTGFQQIQQHHHTLTKGDMRRPSVDLTATQGESGGQGERN
ncbi:hypothetical protein BGX26_012033 [Mortierella sp. AD094]|nr:hypothetical protein BGX26_012033 [Mortierella sp. AD094]